MSYPWQATHEQCRTHGNYLDPYNCQDCNYIYHLRIDRRRRAAASLDIINQSNSTRIPLQHISEPNDVFHTEYEELGLPQYVRRGESEARRMYAEIENSSQQLWQLHNSRERDLESRRQQQERGERYRQEERERQYQQARRRQYQQEREAARQAELRRNERVARIYANHAPAHDYPGTGRY